MQSPAPSGSGSSPPIVLSPLERPAFAHLFSLADPQRTGLVTGDAAVAFFAKSKLPPAVLGQIWALADSANNGFLTPPSFSIALRLISHAQRGESISEALIKRPAPPPTFEGVTLPLSAAAPPPPATSAPNMPGVIEIKPEDRARYTRIFANSSPQQGLIDGEKAKDIFVKSKLPFDKLGAIWNLADTQARGALDLTDFIIGMHFIQNTMNGTLNSIPAVLPPGLYEQAKGSSAIASRVGLPTSPILPQSTGGSASIPRQLTGQPFPGSPAAKPPFPPPAPQAAGGAPWDVTPEEKARSDRFFDGLDAENKGLLDGAAVVPFFMQSKLTEAVLAHVWDLSDITQNGSLTKDEFAVAMHLINGQLAGNELPQELPQTLIPPSMRNLNLPQAVDPQQSDTQKDLFSLMDDDPPAPTVSAASAFITPSPAAPTVSRAAAAAAAAAAAPAPTASGSAPGPFDDDFFGGPAPAAPAHSGQQAALSPVPTGGSLSGVGSPAAAGPGTPSRSGSMMAFGGDQSAEFGNKSIQLQSTQKSVSDLQSKRSTLESAVSTNAASLAELESRLAAVKTQHESETKLVKDLETRQQTQSEELKKLREEVIRDESELSALKAEKDELEQALMRDREDVRDLKKRMAEIQTETSGLKQTLEKLRKDARQQKGLLAISKKQLGTAESERERVQADIGAAERGHVDVDTESAAAGAAGVVSPGVATPIRELPSPAAVSSPLPQPGIESVVSPAASVRSTNPFDRFGTPAPAAAAAAAAAPATASRDEPATSHAGTAGVAAGAAALGAATVAGATAVAATSHEDGSHDTGKDKGVDPFGVPVTDTLAAGDAAGAHSKEGSGFDDAFGAAPAAGNTHSDFDDNFGNDFASATVTAPAPVADAAPATTANSAFDDAFGGFEDDDAAETTAAPAPAPASAPAPAPGTETEPEIETAPISDAPATDGVGAANAKDDGDDDNGDNGTEEDSSDEDEGPEDIDGYKREQQQQQPPSSLPAAETSVAAPAPATTTAAASERFPELAEDGEQANKGVAAGEEQRASMPGGFGFGDDFVAKPAEPAAVEPTAIGSHEGRTASVASIAPVSRQDTGAAAAADDDDVPLGEIVANKSSREASDSAAAAVTSPTTTTRSLSPTSSIKTRRAPPPAPVRGSSTLVAAGGALTNPFGADTGATSSSGTSNNNNFDDFDSAFEDLGQAETAAAPVPAGGGGSNSNFDDAFDTDFDFVPSFAQPSQGPGRNATSGFEDFDSAFDTGSPAPADAVGTGTGTGTAGAGAGAGVGGSQTNSGGSGFSFEDAFVPSSGTESVSGTGTGTTTTYAPPPGPPPPPALPERRDTASASAAALPDDAGPVKQLCGMGFARPKVIAALERSNYRTEKALERLLADS